MLGVRTEAGEGIFVVRGHAPLQLEAKLAPLMACVGRATSGEYLACVTDCGIDRELLTQAQKRWLGTPPGPDSATDEP
jgi:hypothetical protein